MTKVTSIHTRNIMNQNRYRIRNGAEKGKIIDVQQV